MSEQTNYINLDTILGEKQETVKDQVIVIQEAITPITPTRIVDWDSILSEVSYKLPKGYPTVVDGVFTEREEIIIINEALEAEGLPTLPLTEAKDVKVVTSTIKPGPFIKWLDSLTMVKKTAWFELIPVVQAMSGKSKLTVNIMSDTISKKSGLDWGEGKDNIDWITNELIYVAKNKKDLDYVNNEYLPKATGTPLFLRGSNTPSSFLWSKINTTFYKWVKESGIEKNKDFTADVILFWGITDPKSEEDLIRKAIEKPKVVKGSLIDLGNGKFMACVSLKAGVEARMGKVTSYLAGQAGLDADDTTNEAIINESWITDKLTQASDWFKEKFQQVKQFFNDLGKTITDTVNKLPGVSQAEQTAAAIDNLENWLEEYDNNNPTLTEGKEDSGPIFCDTCIQERVKNIQKYIKSFEKGVSLDDLSKQAMELEKLRFFKYKITDIDKNVVKAKKAGLDRLVNTIITAKPANPNSSNYNKAIKAGYKEPKRSTNKCKLLDLAPLDRHEIKNLLFISANANGIKVLNTMFQSILTSVQPYKKNAPKARESFIRYVVNLNAQSIFGGSGQLPLIKYNGKSITYLGTKTDYVNKYTKKIDNDFGESKLPILSMIITPVERAKNEKETPFYYSLALYTLYSVEKEKGDNVQMKYASINFKCNSGSKFAFVIEADNEVTANSLEKKLSVK